MRKYGIFGILFLSLCLFGAVHTAYAAEEEESLQITQEELLDEFDFSDLDDSLKKMFPREKMTFRDVVETLVSGDLKKAGEQFTGFLFDQFFYELQTHRKLLVYLILIAVIAAVFANFSGAFGERQASEIAFYILYMLLIALCLNGFPLGSIRDGDFVKLPAGIYEGALSDVFFSSYSSLWKCDIHVFL